RHHQAPPPSAQRAAARSGATRARAGRAHPAGASGDSGPRAGRPADRNIGERSRRVTGSVSAPVPLRHRSAQLWLVRLDAKPPEYERHLARLAPDELARADRLRFPDDRRRFVVSRAVLRELISRHVRMEPAAIRFRYGPHGKPALERGAQPIEFSMSRAGERALYALAPVPVGVDLVEATSVEMIGTMTGEFCCDEELAGLASAGLEKRKEMLLAIWCRKEAYLKATGSGLAGGMADVNMWDLAGTPAPRTEWMARWTVEDVPVPGPYRAAMAAAR